MKLPAFLLATLGVWWMLTYVVEAGMIVHQAIRLSTEPVEIKSSGYGRNRNLGGSVDEYWLVDSQQADQVVALEVVDAETSFKSDCTKRFVKAYDVPGDSDLKSYPDPDVQSQVSNETREITRFCGSDRPTVKSSGPRMLVVTASRDGTTDGIRLRVYATNPGSGLSGGAIAGVVIGVIAAIVIIIVIIVIVLRRKR